MIEVSGLFQIGKKLFSQTNECQFECFQVQDNMWKDCKSWFI